MNFVISLSSAADRRKHIVNEFQKKSIKFQFFDAVNKDTVNLILETEKVNKKTIYKLCLKVKNEKNY